MPPDIDGIGGRLISSEKPEHTMTALPVVTQLNNSTRERRPEHCGIDGTITQYINRHLRLIPAPSDNPNGMWYVYLGGHCPICHMNALLFEKDIYMRVHKDERILIYVANDGSSTDPLNFPRWRKALAIISVCICM